MPTIGVTVQQRIKVDTRRRIPKIRADHVHGKVVAKRYVLQRE